MKPRGKVLRNPWDAVDRCTNLTYAWRKEYQMRQVICAALLTLAMFLPMTAEAG
jgi:hypothetical protein